MVEWLQPRDVVELGLQQAVDPVDGELPVGAEDVKVAGQRQVLILVAGEAARLDVDDQRVGCQEVSPQDRLLDIGDSIIICLICASEVKIKLFVFRNLCEYIHAHCMYIVYT